MRRIVAVVNHKGGVGKTATAVSVGAALAEGGDKVLLVDFDPQGSATRSLGGTDGGRVLFRALETSASLPYAPTAVPGLDLVASGPALAEARHRFTGAFGLELLRRCLERSPEDWAWQLVDCPPGDELLTTAALSAADHVVVPLEAHPLGLWGLEQIAATVAAARRRNARLEIRAVVPCRAHPRRRVHGQVLERLEALYPGRVTPCVRESAVLAEAPASGRPITFFAPRSAVAEDYRAVARWLAERLS